MTRFVPWGIRKVEKELKALPPCDLSWWKAQEAWYLVVYNPWGPSKTFSGGTIEACILNYYAWKARDVIQQASERKAARQAKRRRQ